MKVAQEILFYNFTLRNDSLWTNLPYGYPVHGYLVYVHPVLYIIYIYTSPPYIIKLTEKNLAQIGEMTKVTLVDHFVLKSSKNSDEHSKVK